MTIPRLIGMVHLLPLPGSPRYQPPFEKALHRAVEDARVLAEAGFEGVIVENFGDVPFYADSVPAITVASMTRAVTEIAQQVNIPLGVNVLRNDAAAALAVCAATNASFIRVNVLTGTMFTDQGIIHGRAAEVARLRGQIAPDVKVLADVLVKHAVPPPGLELEQAATDTWERGGADALVVSGVATGKSTDLEHAARLRRLLPEVPLFIGSGVKYSDLPSIRKVADGVIAGTSLKVGGEVSGPVDAATANRFCTAWKEAAD